jgi:hypothetical protein
MSSLDPRKAVGAATGPGRPTTPALSVTGAGCRHRTPESTGRLWAAIPLNSSAAQTRAPRAPVRTTVPRRSLRSPRGAQLATGHGICAQIAQDPPVTDGQSVRDPAKRATERPATGDYSSGLPYLFARRRSRVRIPLARLTKCLEISTFLAVVSGLRRSQNWAQISSTGNGSHRPLLAWRSSTSGERCVDGSRGSRGGRRPRFVANRRVSARSSPRAPREGGARIYRVGTWLLVQAADERRVFAVDDPENARLATRRLREVSACRTWLRSSAGSQPARERPRAWGIAVTPRRRLA